MVEFNNPALGPSNATAQYFIAKAIQFHKTESYGYRLNHLNELNIAI